MDLIVTHTNADFDAFSSLVAAKKLYPDSRMLMPGSQEPKVREFLSLCKDLIRIESERECSLNAVRRLVIVDTRHASRIGAAAKLLDSKRVKVVIYDHHPRTAFDIKAARDYYEEVGATVTMLIDRIRHKKIPVNPLEATIMALGIYEETGSMTFRTTSRRDLEAVTYLLASGANLSVVSSYLKRELTDKELVFLAKLMHSTRVHNIKGINVAIAKAEADEFIGELGSIVHRLAEVENIKVLFVFIKAAKKLYLIARSRIKNVDVNEIIKEFGGGGHTGASSAVIRDMTAEEAEERLLKKLYAVVRIEVFAKDLMSRPVFTANIDDKVRDVKKRLKKIGVKGLVVMDGGRTAGVVTMGDLNKATRHKLGHSRVKGYMSCRLVSVGPDTPLYEIQRIMLEEKIGRVPVVESGALKGIVTRTDVIKVLYGDLFARRFLREHGKRYASDVKSRMKKNLPRDIYGMLTKIGRLAKTMGCGSFIVGGFVRDLLLGRRNFDIDIVAESDGIGFAGVLAKRLGGRCVIHRRFGTATVFVRRPHGPEEKGLPGVLKIDVATARTEVYEKPAELPQVSFGSIKDDLFRRDFTINAIAASLNPGDFGRLIDFFGGREDLREGIIRVLHDGSFIDDPTRIFRAVRFEQRFGFNIEAHTMELIKNAVSLKMFEKVEPQRIRDEIMLILKEKDPLKALSRMEELHEFRFIHPKMRLTGKIIKTLRSVTLSADYHHELSGKKRSVDVWLMYFMPLLDALSLKDVQELCRKYCFKKSDSLRMLSYKEKGDRLLRFLNRPAKLMPSRIYKMLEPLSYEVILLVYAKSGNRRARARIDNFLKKHNGMRLGIKGDDLKRLGIKPGPAFRRILEKTLHAKIDGKLKTKEDEKRFVLRRFKKAQGPSMTMTL